MVPFHDRSRWKNAASDVGPVSRQIPLEKRGFHGLFLPLRGVLVRCHVPECAVWSPRIVVDPPRFDLGAPITNRTIAKSASYGANSRDRSLCSRNVRPTIFSRTKSAKCLGKSAPGCTRTRDNPGLEVPCSIQVSYERADRSSVCTVGKNSQSAAAAFALASVP